MHNKTKNALILSGAFAAVSVLAGAMAMGLVSGVAKVASKDETVTVKHIASDCQEAVNSNILNPKQCMIDTDKGPFSVGHHLVSGFFYGDKQQAMLDQLKSDKTYKVSYTKSHQGLRTILKLTPSNG